MRKTLQAFIFLFIVINFIGCGTTHHFMPPRPLGDGESLISVAWSYDFNNTHIPALLPSINFYKSIDRNHTLGFGYQIPYFVSHLSAVRYFENNQDSYQNVFLHLNQPLGINNNPYIEFGGSYAIQNKTIWQMGSIGIAYGNGATTPAGLWTLKDSYASDAIGAENRFIPFFKYQVGGKDVSASFYQYFGLRKSVFSKALKNLPEMIDTIAVVHPYQLDSIIEIPLPLNTTLSQYTLYLSNGETILIESADHSFLGCIVEPFSTGFLSFANYNAIEHYLNFENFEWYIVSQKDSTDSYRSTTCYLNTSEILQTRTNNKTIIITTYPENIISMLQQQSERFNDYSVGMSLQDYDFTK